MPTARTLRNGAVLAIVLASYTMIVRTAGSGHRG